MSGLWTQLEQDFARRGAQEAVLEEWIGAWVLNPTTPKDRLAAQLAMESIKFTKAGSFMSPVAVAAIDILGIKDLLAQMPLEEVTERFVEPFYNLNAPLYRLSHSEMTGEEMEEMGFRRVASPYAVTISDTILIFRRPDWELGNKDIAEAHAVVSLAESVCEVIKANSIYRIPLRAAIAFGECLVSVGESRAVLGLATGEASYWERQQEWIGGMVTPSAIETLRRGAAAAKQINGGNFNPPYPSTLVRYPIPLKSDCMALREPQIALNWTTGFTPSSGLIFYNATVPPFPHVDLPEDVRIKHQNTIKFAAYCKTIPLHAPINWDNL